MPALVLPRRDLIRQRRYSPRTARPAERARFIMLDLIYIVVGIAALGVFGLYAAGLRRI
jgi:hypothetical protein